MGVVSESVWIVVAGARTNRVMMHAVHCGSRDNSLSPSLPAVTYPAGLT